MQAKDTRWLSAERNQSVTVTKQKHLNVKGLYAMRTAIPNLWLLLPTLFSRYFLYCSAFFLFQIQLSNGRPHWSTQLVAKSQATADEGSQGRVDDADAT